MISVNHALHCWGKAVVNDSLHKCMPYELRYVSGGAERNYVKNQDETQKKDKHFFLNQELIDLIDRFYVSQPWVVRRVFFLEFAERFREFERMDLMYRREAISRKMRLTVDNINLIISRIRHDLDDYFLNNAHLLSSDE